jgi:phosphoribosylformylglycinamidine cyclo-ligase
VIKKSAVKIPAIFNLIADVGKIAERDMFNTFNMGVGMVIVCRAADANAALAILREEDPGAYLLGEIAAGKTGVELL